MYRHQSSKPSMTGHKVIATLLLAFLFSGSLVINGCEEQPVGYIFSPTQRDQIQAVSTFFDFLQALYVHTDQAARFLDEAALTNNYASVLPEGWLPLQNPTGDFFYLRNYLDQQFHLLQFDNNPTVDAVRTPSDLVYNYLEIGSFRDSFTQSFYGDTSEAFNLTIEYSDDRQETNFVDGIFQIQRAVEFEIEIPITGQDGGSTSVTDYYWVLVTWLMKIEHYSIDPDDQRARITLDGMFPYDDETYERHEIHVSGEVEIDKHGRGTGEMWLYGEPVARIHLSGRRSGFLGYFTLHSEDHEKRYR